MTVGNKKTTRWFFWAVVLTAVFFSSCGGTSTPTSPTPGAPAPAATQFVANPTSQQVGADTVTVGTVKLTTQEGHPVMMAPVTVTSLPQGWRAVVLGASGAEVEVEVRIPPRELGFPYPAGFRPVAIVVTRWDGASVSFTLAPK